MPDTESTPGIGTSAPVSPIPSDSKAPGPEEGVALCLSGGGYRAMVFHLGALVRLNEAGILPLLDRVSSVSGGSITAAMLGLRWRSLDFRDSIAANLRSEVVEPVLRLASETIDASAVVSGIMLPGTVSDKIAAAYDRMLFHGATLQDLPEDTAGPMFVINATNVQSGALWRFAQPYMADYLVGRVMRPRVPLASAVAASSAFPPVLSPARLELIS